jgi:hypothetical protein
LWFVAVMPDGILVRPLVPLALSAIVQRRKDTYVKMK